MPAFLLSLSDRRHPLPRLESALGPVQHVAGAKTALQTISAGALTVRYYGPPEGFHQPNETDPAPGFLVAGRVNRNHAARLLRDVQNHAKRDLGSAQPLAWIAEAWALWGEATLQRLDGDFGFAVIDRESGEAWLATDRFAVIPMHYRSARSELLVSNILSSVVNSTDRNDRFNESALADFLLFGHSRSADATFYEGIERLPPATCLRWREGTQNLNTWWTLPNEFKEPVGSDDELAIEFRDRLKQAVESARDDRAAAVLTSSGMDSTTVASLSAKLSKQDAGYGPTLLATLDTPESPELSEVDLSRRFARELKVEQLALPSPSGPLFDDARRSPWPAPEPWWHQWNRFMQPGLTVIGEHAEVGLTGQGGDMVLFPDSSFFVTQLRQGRLARGAREWTRFRKTQARSPALGIKSALWGTQRFDEIPAMPRWLRSGLVTSLDLQGRLDGFVQAHQSAQSRRRDRHQAVRQLQDPYLGFVLGGHAPSTTGVGLEFTHPFLATNVLQFALGLRSPSLLYGKQILRLAMRSDLPDFILSQRKRLIAPDVRRHMILETPDSTWQQAAADLERFDSAIDPKQFLSVALKRNQLNSTEAELLKLPLVLHHWHSSCQLEGPGDQ